MLAITLKGVVSQLTDPPFTIEIVVVDNDKMRSAEEMVQQYAEMGPYKIIYDCEPEQSIPLARNRTIRNANGNFVATIDDDEFPSADWLSKMYRCLKAYDADGVLGPVLPHFPSGAPEWLKKSGLCDRPRNPTGSLIMPGRTGNALFKRQIFEENDMWFDPKMALSGGSDGEFLDRQIEKDRIFVWCDEAIVFETVVEERWKAQFYLRRHFRIGALMGENNRRFVRTWAVFKNFALLSYYAALLPLFSIAGKHNSMKILTKIYYNAGSILSFFSLIHEQPKE